MSRAVKRFIPAFWRGAKASGKHIWIALALALALALAAPASAQDLPTPKAKHVVLLIWDGMRPDFIEEKNTPNAWALAQRGTFFANNHASYISTTEVNGSSISTGMKPYHHGIFANAEYRPEINLLKPIATQGAWNLRIGDALTDRHWLLAPTIAERVRAAGYTTAVAGTKEVVLLHDRYFDRTGASPTVFQGMTYPRPFGVVLERLLGKWPDPPKENSEAEMKKPGAVGLSNTAENRWTTHALIEELWKTEVPKFTTLWLGDPDYSQHLTRPGSPTALAAIHDCDNNLGLILSTLQARGELENTDVFLVSDHGFSTVHRNVELGKVLGAFGRDNPKVKFNAATAFKRTPHARDVLINTTGASTSLYVIEHEPEIIDTLVDWLQRSDFAGPIFTKDGLPGTFKFSDAWINTEHVPDIMFSASWSDLPNQHGTPGGLFADASKPNLGTHGSLSPFDIHNTLLAAGPDLRAGLRNELPSGNVDVAPTILHLLGIKPDQPLDGRILVEALVGSTPPAIQPEVKRLEQTRDLGDGKTWKQWIQFTQFGDKTYLDRGNSANGEHVIPEKKK